MSAEGYSLQQVVEMRMSTQDAALSRIEGLVTAQGQQYAALAKDVADLRVENAKQAGKMAILMVVLGAAASSVGVIVTAVILDGAPK